MSTRSPITTHVLDTSRGRPAAGVPVSLARLHDVDDWHELALGTTDDDGRVTDLIAPGSLERGTYRIRFETGTYFEEHGISEYFYPFAEVVFRIENVESHYHVPLLLNPFGYSTYRGS